MFNAMFDRTKPEDRFRNSVHKKSGGNSGKLYAVLNLIQHMRDIYSQRQN